MNQLLQKYAETWWDTIPQHKSEADALGFVYKTIYQLFKDNKFEVVDAILEVGLPYINFSTVIKLGILTTTSKAKDKLSNRKTYYDMCHSHFVRKHGKEKTQSLLIGLE